MTVSVMRARPARFAVVWVTLFVGHQVGDYLLSTDVQAVRKPARTDREVDCSEAASWVANQTHMVSYHAAQLAALLLANHVVGLGIGPGRLALGLGWSWVSHSLIDRRWPVRRWMDATGSAEFRRRGGGLAANDQAIHYACLWVAAVIITAPARGRRRPGAAVAGRVRARSAAPRRRTCW